MPDYLRLSMPELLTALAHMGITDFGQVRDHPIMKLSDAEIKGAMLAARQGLVARELATYDAAGNFNLNDVIRFTLAVCARPAATIWAIVGDAPGTTTRHRFFNITPPAGVEYIPEETGVQRFSSLENMADVETGLLQDTGLASWAATEAGQSYEVPANLLLEFSDGIATEAQAAALKDKLVQAGLPAATAAQYATAAHQGEQRVMLLGLIGIPLPQDQQRAEAISWLRHGGQVWVNRDKGDGQTTVLATVTAPQIATDLQVFVQHMWAEAAKVAATA